MPKIKKEGLSKSELEVLNAMLNYDGDRSFYKNGWLSGGEIYAQCTTLQRQNVENALNGSKDVKGLLPRGIIQKKTLTDKFDGRRQGSKYHYKLKTNKKTFLYLYVLFYDHADFDVFTKSHYFTDNFKDVVEEYDLLTAGLFGGEDAWLKGQIKKINLKYAPEVNPILFYAYAKDKARFQRMTEEFVNEFKKRGIKPSHFYDLLSLAVHLTLSFSAKFKNPESEVDFQLLFDDYTLVQTDVFDFMLGPRCEWLKPEVKDLFNEALSQHTREYMLNHSLKDKKLKTRRRKDKK